MNLRLIAAEAAALIALAALPAIGEGILLRHNLSWYSPVPPGESITVFDAIALGDSALWIDARPQDDFEREHVPGAVSLNEDHWNEMLPRILENWTPDKRIVVYCSSEGCGASREVARRLRSEAQLRNVFVLEGGWEAWLARNK